MSAQPLRVASFDADLTRRGPGVLLHGLLRGDDEQARAVAQVIAHAAPDILLLNGVDYDADLHALRALRDLIAAHGHRFEHLFALRPNSGMQTGLDLDGDGNAHTARDAQGYGRFGGHGGMAVLSRHPIREDDVRDFSAFLWRDLPGADMPLWKDGTPFPSPRAQAIQRLSSVGHWVVPVDAEGRILTLLASNPTPPVFDGPEDRNGRRNADEIRFWQHFLDGAFGPAPTERFVILGNLNLDPEDGQGRRDAIRALLSDPRLQDPEPASAGGAQADDPLQTGDPSLDTAAFDPPVGHLRTDYVLPSADLAVAGAGVLWPAPDDAMAAVAASVGRHRLVWVDLDG